MHPPRLSIFCLRAVLGLWCSSTLPCVQLCSLGSSFICLSLFSFLRSTLEARCSVSFLYWIFFYSPAKSWIVVVCEMMALFLSFISVFLVPPVRRVRVISPPSLVLSPPYLCTVVPVLSCATIKVATSFS